MDLYYDDLQEHLSYLNKRQVNDELWPYKQYLNRIKEYYQIHPKILEYETLDDDSSKHTIFIKTDNRDIWDDHTRFVYEHDPNDSNKLFDDKNRITIKSRNKLDKMLELERIPNTPKLKLNPNLTNIIRQEFALNDLHRRPVKEYDGILKLLHPQDTVEWPSVEDVDVDEWFVLTDVDRKGTLEQRRFVEKALGTADFAFLEGPPGSGKTTALCELVRQIVSRKKSVLFCASTNVAVDNLLERLIDEDGTPVQDLIPLRIGKSDKISEKIEKYRYDEFMKTKADEMKKLLAESNKKSRAQEMMIEALRGEEMIGCIARDCANLVCGTTFGIVSYPDIKTGSKMFDYMIIDEASKTTFREFLVPAIHASRWIIAGDTKQLAPHTDQDEIAENLKACIDMQLGQACVDAFMARPGHRNQLTVVIPTDDPDLQEMYRARCNATGTNICSADKTDYKHPCVILDSPKAIAGMDISGLPDKNTIIRNYNTLERSKHANGKNLKFWRRAARIKDEHTWENQVAWRMALRTLGNRITDEIDMLEPDDPDPENMHKLIMYVKKMSLPSMLESIQDGFEDADNSTALDRGMPDGDFGDRHVLLTWQHRMHKEIVDFSYRYIYGQKALHTPDSMETDRMWKYDRYKNRMVWIDVRTGSRESGSYKNEKEAKCIVEEIDRFVKWAEKNPRPDGMVWDVAILPFYVDQLFVIRKHLQQYAGSGNMTFNMADGRVTINLRTLDSFQGHEADIVFLSLAHWYPTMFLNNPNRLNVGLTRARYQCVIVGDNSAMKRADPPIGRLAGEVEVVTSP